MRVGIPRTLNYFSYYPMWKTFFENLGLQVIVSDITSKEILDDGVRETVTDACMPIKVLHGHVINLKDKVDYIFLPRIVSVNKDETFCPKFLGLPDMVVASIENLPILITERVDLKEGKLELFKVSYRIGRLFNHNFFKIYKAYRLAIQSLNKYKKDFINGSIPTLDINPEAIKGKIKLAVLGYPYMLYDRYLSLDLIYKLIKMNVEIVTPEMFEDTNKKEYPRELSKPLFWHYSNNVIKTAYKLFVNKKVDGIIHLTAFGCGPDFMVDKLLEIESKNRKIPFMNITFDEHTGEEGIKTRLEAFVDILEQRRLRNENNISLYE